MSAPVLELRDVAKRFGPVTALDRLSLAIKPGRILGLVGASGSGKSTLANLILGLDLPDGGTIFYRGAEVKTLDRRGRRAFRADVQMVFQDPFASLNPHVQVLSAVEEPLIIQRRGAAARRRELALTALEQSGLRPAEAFAGRFPHSLSGGQRQRVAIARAIVLQPSLLVADEPTSMLDVSIRNSVMQLFRSFADRQGMGIVLITHDLSILVPWCDEIAVLHLGSIVESGSPQAIVGSPKVAYTKALLAAVPRLPNVAK